MVSPKIGGVNTPTFDKRAQKKAVTPADVAEEPLIVSHQVNANRDWQRWLGKEEGEVRIAAMYSLLYNGAKAVEAGMGIALAIAGIAPDDGKPLVFRPLLPELLTPVYMVWGRDHAFSGASRLFKERLLNAFSPLDVAPGESVQLHQ